MPQARSSGTRSTRAKASSSKSSGGAKRTQAGGDGASAAGAADDRFEATAQRIRKLNERIIGDARHAGEVTLGSYERALKSMASALERGPGSSDIEWISQLATIQAKFIRDVTDAWTAAARGMMKQ
jgi:hypothetical protein